MKMSISILLSALITFTTFAQTTAKQIISRLPNRQKMAIFYQPVAQADVSAIKAVVERETTAWSNRDAAAFVDCWANIPEAGTLVMMADANHTIISSRNTKQDIPISGKALIASMGKSTGETFQNSDYLIRVNGNAAFVQYKQVVTAPDGKKEYAHQTRYLEKIGEKWKIVHVGAVFYKK